MVGCQANYVVNADSELGNLTVKTCGETFETFLAFNVRAVPLAVLNAVLWIGVARLTPPMMEGDVKMHNPSEVYFHIAIATGIFYFSFLLEWLIERIKKAKGKHPKTSSNLSFRKVSVLTMPWIILGALVTGGLFFYIAKLFSVAMQRELIWPIWGPPIVVGALLYSIVVLEWLSHRVYRAAAQKLLPAH